MASRLRLLTIGGIMLVLALSLFSCQTMAVLTTKSFSVASGYNEKRNVDVTAAVFMMSRLPVDVLQIYKNVNRPDDKISYGIYNSFKDDTRATRPYFSVIAFTVDGKRTDFYSAPFGTEDAVLAKASEAGYFFSNKPAAGTNNAATESEMLPDSDPAATDAAIVTLLTSIKDVQSVSIKLFPDRDGVESYTFVVSPEDLLTLKSFCKTVGQ